MTLSPHTRRILAAALVVILALAATGAALAVYRYTHGPIPVRPHLGAPLRECGQGSVYMVDANVGWQGTQRTTDGGHSWHDVAPPTVPGSLAKQLGTTCALDAQRAWLAIGSGSVAYQPDHVVVMSTIDGGQTWQQLGVIPVGFPVLWQHNFAVELDFLDDHHGWLLIEYASAPMVRYLYSTSDGGTHWARVSTSPGLGLGDFTVGCAENGIMFSSLQRGWLAWDCSRGYGDRQVTNGPVIAFTNDGGRNWAPLNLQAYPGGGICAATTPVFSRTHGVLEASCLGTGLQGGGWAAVYSTVDAGGTWSANVLPIWTAVDMVDGDTAFYFQHVGKANTLYRTMDGGASWSVVASGLFSGNTVGSFVFVDTTNGFANVSNSPVPWWTNDGGKTWATEGGRRQVGNVVCTLPSDRNMSPSLAAVKMVSPTTGWAAGARRTIDGGVTWVNTNPPQAKYSTYGYGEFFLDSLHAWVAESVGSPKACSDRFVVFSTVNGGSTWQQGAQVPIQLPGLEESDGSWTILLYFVDPDHGWLRITTLLGPGPLYRTVDGGQNWTLVASQAIQADQGCNGRGQFAFSSPTTGWMSEGCGKAADAGLDILVTRDGGSTWKLQSLAANYCSLQRYSGGCEAPLPTFFDPSNGWLIDLTTQTLLMTSDGGLTWSRHGLPQLATYSCTGKYGDRETCLAETVVAASFVDPLHGWTFINRPNADNAVNPVRFERTVDGGQTWTTVNSNLVGSGLVPELPRPSLTFIDQSNGFLWTGTELYAPLKDNPDLFRTTDGGQTWLPLPKPYQ